MDNLDGLDLTLDFLEEYMDDFELFHREDQMEVDDSISRRQIAFTLAREAICAHEDDLAI
ncbi:hypothetical protein HK101_006547, partial [Irineochytrium annulatum]